MLRVRECVSMLIGDDCPFLHLVTAKNSASDILDVDDQ
jgi:hypothetical protein